MAEFELGWNEWLALPALGLSALRAKVDSGAKTSSLHATQAELFGPAADPSVKFLTSPDPDQPDFQITCSARVVGRRSVKNSDGHSEMRFVIESPVRMGAREWPIEITLNDRSFMSFRMLLGRQAFQHDMMIRPTQIMLQAELDYSVYESENE